MDVVAYAQRPKGLFCDRTEEFLRESWVRVTSRNVGLGVVRVIDGEDEDRDRLRR